MVKKATPAEKAGMTYRQFLKRFIGRRGAFGNTTMPEFELSDTGPFILFDVQNDFAVFQTHNGRGSYGRSHDFIIPLSILCVRAFS
jgi:hypothetical protein